MSFKKRKKSCFLKSETTQKIRILEHWSQAINTNLTQQNISTVCNDGSVTYLKSLLIALFFFFLLGQPLLKSLRRFDHNRDEIWHGCSSVIMLYQLT